MKRNGHARRTPAWLGPQLERVRAEPAGRMLLINVNVWYESLNHFINV